MQLIFLCALIDRIAMSRVPRFVAWRPVVRFLTLLGAGRSQIADRFALHPTQTIQEQKLSGKSMSRVPSFVAWRPVIRFLTLLGAGRSQIADRFALHPIQTIQEQKLSGKSMARGPSFVAWIPILVGFLTLLGCGTSQRADRLALHIDSLESVYAPDHRRALWQLQIQSDEKGLYLMGRTDQSAAVDELRPYLLELGIRDSLSLWPDTAALGGKIRGIVGNSVANLRGEPRHSSELVTQALLGTPLLLLGREGNWFLVQMPDKYIAWIDEREFTSMFLEEFDQWLRQPKLFFTQLEGHAYTDSSEQVMVSDLVLGAIISTSDRSNTTHQEVIYPDGRLGWLRKSEVTSLESFYSSQNSSYYKERMFRSTSKMIGLPYLWGGSSTKGMDCSGFTKMLFFLGGWIIPRDASQQAEEGDTITTKKEWHRLQIGDLLFFGPSDGRSNRVSHVGFWLGEGHFIHSSGRVRISSVHTDDASYDSAYLKRFLFAKRYLRPSAQLLPLMASATYYRK